MKFLVQNVLTGLFTLLVWINEVLTIILRRGLGVRNASVFNR
jgi:hypothetical protein